MASNDQAVAQTTGSELIGEVEEQSTALEVYDPCITFSDENLVEAVIGASALRDLDVAREDEALVQRIVGHIPKTEDEVSAAVLYQAAKGCGVPAKYVEKYLMMRYPSVELQLSDLKEHGGVPSIEIITQAYENGILGALRNTMPLNEFRCEYTGRGQPVLKFQIQTKERTGGFWGFFQSHDDSEWGAVGNLFFYSDTCSGYSNGQFGVNAQVYDPLFLRSAGATIKQLNKGFESLLKKYLVKHHYSVNG